MPFVMPQKVLFKHCDPAGIVFYPRYFEMINDCVEAFFDAALDWPFEALHTTGGVPTAEITAQFKAPCRHGDTLELRLSCTRLGGSSLGLDITTTCGGDVRFTAQSTLVHVNLNGKPTNWPAALRAKLEQQVKEASL